MTDRGRPYFVMEYVDGLPITEYCDRHRLSIEDRLRLFQQVCHAVQHAHQKGIIHRDLNPSNIQVSQQDARPVPKIIDFGVARAICQPLTDQTLVTEDSHLLGTPEYMSPEQADLSKDIDVRSDVYSLGVLLYVLLSGALPFDTDTLREGGLEHLRKVIRDQEPKTPAARLSGLAKQGEAVASRRQTDRQTLTRKLHRELEWIPLKAMRKERQQRYQSVAELAQDVANYLDHAPLIAGPPGGMYRLRKFVRRHRNPVIGTVALLAVLIAGTVTSTLFAIQAKRQARIAVAVNTFFNENLLGSLTPYQHNVGEVTFVAVLDAASENLKDQFKDEPLIEATIRHTLAASYVGLGEFSSAEKHLERALQIRRELLGEEHRDTLDSMYLMAFLYPGQARNDEAVQLAIRTVEGCRRMFGPEHVRTLLAMHLLGRMYLNQGRVAEAQRVLEDGARTARRALGEEHRYTLLIAGYLSDVYQAQGHLKEAEAFLENTLPAYRRAWGQEHVYTLDRMYMLGMLYTMDKNPADAKPILRQVLEARRRVMGEEHVATLDAMRWLGRCHMKQGRLEEAEPLITRAYTITIGKYGEEHRNSLWSMQALIGLRIQQKRYEEAETLYLKLIKGWSRMVGKDYYETLRANNELGALYVEQARYIEAEPLLRATFEECTVKLGKQDRVTLSSANGLGVLHMRQGRFDEAEPLLLQAAEGRTLKFGADDWRTLESLNDLIALYDSWNKPEEAHKWRAKLGAASGVATPK